MQRVKKAAATIARRRRAGERLVNRPTNDCHKRCMKCLLGELELERGTEDFLQGLQERRVLRIPTVGSIHWGWQSSVRGHSPGSSGQTEPLCDLSADRGADGAGDGLGEALDVGVMFGFDHDAGELLSTG